MFNGFMIEKENSRKREADSRLKKAVVLKNRQMAQRDHLSRKYSQRITEFIDKMRATPVLCGQYVPPVIAATHDSDPKKFKGKSSVICYRYIPEKERIGQTIDSYKFLSSPVNNRLLGKQARFAPLHSPSKLSQQLHSIHKEKTYFTGVTSILVGPSRPQRTASLRRNNSEVVNTLARRVLEDSQVFRKGSEFLKKGQGKLACCPSRVLVHSSLDAY